jgi:hypothetical protein
VLQNIANTEIQANDKLLFTKVQLYYLHKALFGFSRIPSNR